MLNAGLLPFRSDRVVLRAMRQSDARAYASGAADPAVRQFAHLPEPEYTEASVTELVAGPVQDGLSRGDLAVLTIAEPSTDAFAGSLVLFDIEDESVEVGFWLHPDHRGQGIAAAALDLAERFVVHSGFTRIRARTVPENQASQRVLERCGFSRGRATREPAPSGQEVLVLHYGWSG